MNIGREAVKLFTSDAASQMIYLVATVFFASTFGPNKIGSFYLFESIMVLSSIFFDLGIKGAIKKRISENENNSGALSAGIITKFLALLLGVLLVALMDSLVINYVNIAGIVPIILSILLYNTYDTSLFILQGEKQIGKSAFAKLLNRVVWAIGGGGFVLLGLGIESLVLSYMCGLLVATCFSVYSISSNFEIPRKSSYESIFKYAQYNFISSVSGFSFGWLDVTMLGILVGPTAVGLYETAWRVTEVISLVSSSIGSTMFPIVSEASAADNYKKVEELVSSSLYTALYFSVPAVLGLLTISSELLLVVFGSEFVAASPILSVLVIHKALLPINSITGQALHALDLPSLAAKASLIGTISNIFLNVILILNFGAIGAAIGTVMAYALNTGAHYKYLNSKVRVPITYVFFRMLAYSLPIILIVRAVRQMINMNTLFGLFLAIGVSAIFYFTITLNSRSMRTRLLEIWKVV